MENRRRPRRLDAAQRQSAHEQESARNIANQHSSRFLSKHKTRCVPDAPGISILSKTEVKKDLRLLERSTSFVVSQDSDDESDVDGKAAAEQYKKDANIKTGAINAVKAKKVGKGKYNPNYLYGHGGGIVMRSVKPPCAPESTILRKKRRYNSWLKPTASAGFDANTTATGSATSYMRNMNLPLQVDETAIARELGAYEQAIQQLKFHYEGFFHTEEHWVQNVEYSREVLSAAMSELATCNHRLEAGAQALFSRCLDECNATNDVMSLKEEGRVGGRGSGSGRGGGGRSSCDGNAAGNKKEHASTLKHILQELRDRQQQQPAVGKSIYGDLNNPSHRVETACFSLDDIMSSASSADATASTFQLAISPISALEAEAAATMAATTVPAATVCKDEANEEDEDKLVNKMELDEAAGAEEVVKPSGGKKDLKRKTEMHTNADDEKDSEEEEEEEEEETDSPVEDALALYLQSLDEVIRLNELSVGEVDEFYVYKNVVTKDRPVGNSDLLGNGSSNTTVNTTSAAIATTAAEYGYGQLFSLLCDSSSSGTSMTDAPARLKQFEIEQARHANNKPSLLDLLPTLPRPRPSTAASADIDTDADGDGVVPDLDDEAYWSAVIEAVGNSSALLHEYQCRCKEAASSSSSSSATEAKSPVRTVRTKTMAAVANSAAATATAAATEECQQSLVSLQPLISLLSSAGLHKESSSSSSSGGGGGGGGVLSAERALQLYMNATTATSSTTSTRKQTSTVLKKLVLTTIILMNASVSGICSNRLRGYDTLGRTEEGETITFTNYVPLLLSPLSQYADGYAGSLTGCSVVFNDSTSMPISSTNASSGGVPATSARYKPSDIARREESVLQKYNILAKILSLQNYYKRAVTRRNDWKRHLTKAQMQQAKAQTQLRDLLDDISVERELHAQAQVELQRRALTEKETAAAEENGEEAQRSQSTTTAITIGSDTTASATSISPTPAVEEPPVIISSTGVTSRRAGAGGRFSAGGGRR